MVAKPITVHNRRSTDWSYDMAVQTYTDAGQAPESFLTMPTSFTTAPATTNTPSSSSSSSPLSSAVIIGIVVAVLGLGGSLATLTWYLIRRRKRSRPATFHPDAFVREPFLEKRPKLSHKNTSSDIPLLYTDHSRIRGSQETSLTNWLHTEPSRYAPATLYPSPPRPKPVQNVSNLSISSSSRSEPLQNIGPPLSPRKTPVPPLPRLAIPQNVMPLNITKRDAESREASIDAPASETSPDSSSTASDYSQVSAWTAQGSSFPLISNSISVLPSLPEHVRADVLSKPAQFNSPSSDYGVNDSAISPFVSMYSPQSQNSPAPLIPKFVPGSTSTPPQRQATLNDDEGYDAVLTNPHLPNTSLQLPPTEEPPSQLERGKTRAVAQLLLSRAKRHGLKREMTTSSRISHIELGEEIESQIESSIVPPTPPLEDRRTFDVDMQSSRMDRYH